MYVLCYSELKKLIEVALGSSLLVFHILLQIFCNFKAYGYASCISGDSERQLDWLVLISCFGIMSLSVALSFPKGSEISW